MLSPSRAGALAAMLFGLSLGCGRTGLRAPPIEEGGAGGDGGAGAAGGSGGSGASAGSGGSGGSGASAGSGGSGGSGASAGSGGSGASAGSGGSGGAEPCSIATQCDDGDVCTTDACVGGFCQSTPRDDDADGFGPLSCGGPDCNDLNPNVAPGAPEQCADGSDNDCNGVADCLDPACVGVPNCGCQPKPEECTGGTDEDCDGAVDCLDASCAGTPACGCAPSETGLCDNGFDDDCDGAIDCDDSQCSASAQCQCQAKPEQCGNGSDDDCDLLVDCADPNCGGLFPCVCVPPGSPEQCGNGFDDDCDGKVDCADSNCFASPTCSACTLENCADGIDNSCDGLIDCADPACVFAPNCAPTQEVCNNSLDDDLDGLTDCDDPDCANVPACALSQSNCLTAQLVGGSGSYFGDTTGNVGKQKGSCGGDAGEAIYYFTLSKPAKVIADTIGTSFDSNLYVRAGSCENGQELGCDDDSGGSFAAKLTFQVLPVGTYYVFVDGYTIDPQAGANEGPYQFNLQILEDPPEDCANEVDDDGDVYVDCADPDCSAVAPCSTCLQGGPAKPEFGVAACTNGLDDDCDGTLDCADDDCSASDNSVTECCDGTDENGNGIPDDFNCRCASNADCPAGQICYAATAFSCGIPCDNFFGDVCPFVAAGSSCNVATQQCQF